MADTLWCSLFEYGAAFAESWQTTLPVRPWTRRVPTVGGSRDSATGVMAGYVVRSDHVLAVTVRYYEGEWPELWALIAWGQSAETFLWYPDGDVATSYEVYLHSPRAGTDVQETRSQEFPLAMEVTLEFRRIDGVAWDLEYFPT